MFITLLLLSRMSLEFSLDGNEGNPSVLSGLCNLTQLSIHLNYCSVPLSAYVVVRCWQGGWDDPFPCLSWLLACLLLCAPIWPRSIGVLPLNNTFTSATLSLYNSLNALWILFFQTVVSLSESLRVLLSELEFHTSLSVNVMQNKQKDSYLWSL